MKILQVTPFFSPVHGGSAEVPYQLSSELAKKGHKVTIYTSDYKFSQEYVNSIPKVRVCIFKTWVTRVKFFIAPGMVRQARKEVKHFEIIHMHNYHTFQNIVAHHYAKKYGIPYVLQAHGSLVTYFQKGMLKRVFDRLWGYTILKGASKVIAVTKTEVEQYKSMGVSEDKIEIVPNGIDLSEFDNLPERGEFTRKYGLNDNQKIILYLGRIDKIKGLDILTKAFAQLSRNVKDVKLVIVGPDDGYLPSLRKLVADLEIGDKVLFTAPLYGREKLEAYIDAYVYVLPSFYEIFGITVLEATACGTSVIATDRCGIADVIDGQAGLVVPYDKDQLSNAILHMLSDDKMRREFGEKGKLLVREKFNWEKIAEQIENVYQSVIQTQIEGEQ
ncbi:MAG: Phosphatidyl-myo-inositol mannosyltransferase [Syntrophomonadaceae bacterium]|nr:Phosphatidyl-myo-inositol mannosyltransferase [Bacillota bacterium]